MSNQHNADGRTIPAQGKRCQSHQSSAPGARNPMICQWVSHELSPPMKSTKKPRPPVLTSVPFSGRCGRSVLGICAVTVCARMVRPSASVTGPSADTTQATFRYVFPSSTTVAEKADARPGPMVSVWKAAMEAGSNMMNGQSQKQNAPGGAGRARQVA